MKSKLSSTFNKLRIIMVAALTVFCVSCDKTETTDTTGFILHYLGITDIGPSMSYTLKAPAYKGSTPYDFTITKITLDNESFSNNDNFVINSETGEITVQNTDEMKPGLYNISVGCYSNGKFFDFKDAVQVNMLLAVPEGVSVEPAEVLVKMEDENWWEASAKVTTDAEKHVSIIKYEFAEDESREYRKYFTIENGIITFNPDQKDNIVPGEKYVLSLKLTTKAGEHLYPDAVTFKVISKPYNLQYKPKEVKVEKNTAHESQLPTIQGSEGMNYSIKSISPEATGFTIDEKTGKISIAENSLSTIGAIYNINVMVSNEYGSAEFPEAYTVTVVDFINPIDPTTFSYVVPETYEEMEYTIPVAGGLIGDEVIYNFADNNSEAIKEQIEKGRMSIDIESGKIFIAKKNTLAPGDYTVSVKASNVKSEVTTSFTLTIKANPNKFTFYYGNNLGLSPAENYANQYEVDYDGTFSELKALNLTPTTTLNGKNAKWELVVKKVLGGKDQLLETTINENTGTIDFSNAKLQSADVCVGMLVVKATVGDGPLAYSVTAPVFVRSSKKASENLIKYTPFVIQMNPKTGGRSAIPTTVASNNLIMDFRTNFNFFEVNTTTANGVQPATAGSIMNDLWVNFYKTTGANSGNVNTGAKKPMSSLDTSNGFDNTKNLDMTLGYFDQTDRSIVINPDMWKSATGEYANGVLIPQVAVSTDGSVPDKTRIIPIAIWFDENFE